MVVWTKSHMWKLPYLPMNFHSIHCALWNLYSNKSFLLVRFEFEWISPVYPPNINMEAPCTWQEKINNKLYRQHPQTANISKMIHDYVFQMHTKHFYYLSYWMAHTKTMSQHNVCCAVIMDTSLQRVMFMHVEVFNILECYAVPIGSKLSINTA